MKNPDILKKLVTNFILSNKSFMIIYIIIILLTWPAESIVLSRLYSNLITSLKSKASFNNIFNLYENISKNNIFGVLSLILIVWVFLIIFYRLKYTMEQKLFPIYMSYIRRVLIDGILKSNSTNFKDIKTGEYIAIINELTHVFLSLLQMITNKFLPILMGLIAISIYYLYINTTVGTAFLSLSIIRIINLYVQGITYAKSCALRDKSYFKLNEHINDTFNNSMNIHLNNTMQHEKAKGKKMTDKYDIEQEEEMRVRTSITWMSNLLTVICFIVIIIITYYLFTKNKISLTSLLTIAFIEIKLVGTFIDFDSLSLNFFQKFGTIIATQDFLNEILSDSDEKNKKCKMKSGEIEIKNMSFMYDEKSPAIFSNMNLNIKSGDRVGLVGRSGSGKTTLMKILLGLHYISDGEINIGGCNINNIKSDILRDKVIYINQRTSLFNETVIKNIQYGNSKLTESEIISFLKKYKLYEIYNRLDNGIYSKAGVNGSLLSLGMQKVTMILRGIFKKEGDIYIFDEPLAGLDEHTRSKIIEIINNIPKEKTIIVVTHDPEILSHLNNVYRLDDLHNKLSI